MLSDSQKGLRSNKWPKGWQSESVFSSCIIHSVATFENIKMKNKSYSLSIWKLQTIHVSGIWTFGSCGNWQSSKFFWNKRQVFSAEDKEDHSCFWIISLSGLLPVGYMEGILIFSYKMSVAQFKWSFLENILLLQIKSYSVENLICLRSTPREHDSAYYAKLRNSSPPLKVPIHI